MTLAYHTPLDDGSLRAMGIPAPWRFGLADRVRFGEIDALGHVNHTAYLRWFESFRLPFLRARGVTDYGPAAPRLVLRGVACTYRAEMGLSEDYVVTGRVARFRRTSFTMVYAVWRPGAGPERPAAQTAEGEAVLVILNRAGPGRAPIPEAARAAFREEDGAMEEAAPDA